MKYIPMSINGVQTPPTFAIEMFSQKVEGCLVRVQGHGGRGVCLSSELKFHICKESIGMLENCEFVGIVNNHMIWSISVNEHLNILIVR